MSDLAKSSLYCLWPEFLLQLSDSFLGPSVATTHMGAARSFLQLH